ncbi:HtaA domain-containing protein [Corynebacterium confusum]|uniref:HtaA domain-containing protein n=1 Tax=Corynebacterium confusum TaxID=71254 RepID=UPI0025B521A3|nr:HtaA domain-containing protein [Corynebacterium confusum]WJY88845.1 Htaa [Corynebacterium confusum]
MSLSLRGITRLFSFRTSAAVAAAGALAFAPAAAFTVATPAAHAAGTCEFNWGIKQSYRAYIQGNVAKGGWGGDGIGFTGSETGDDGAFQFKPKKPQVDGDAVTVPLNGVLHFNGHNYGGDDLLDMTLSDWKVRAQGNTADIMVDYVSYESDMVDTSKRGDKITGDDEVIATINLDSPFNPDSGAVDLSGSTTLTQGGNRLFLAYDPGTPMDPTSGGAALDGSCGSESGPGSDSGSGNKRTLTTISGNFTGFNKQVMDILSETNDTMNALTTFMGNTQAFLDEYESFTNRGGKSGSGSGSGTTSGTTSGTKSGSTSGATSGSKSGSNSGSNSGPNSASGGKTSGGSGSKSGSTSGTGSGSGAGAGSTGGSAAGGSGGSDVKCEAVKAVESAEAAWALKESFQSYITGSIAKGKWDLSGVGYEGGEYRFTGNGGNVDTDSQQGTIIYGGSMQFTGHNGILDLNIANPEIQFNGNGGQLVADVRSSNMEGEKIDFGRTALGELNFSDLNVTDSSVSGSATVLLTNDGSKAFAEFYDPGTELAPLSFSAQLGGAGDCDGVGGTAASGSSSGSGSTGGSAAARSAGAAKLAERNGGFSSSTGADGENSSAGYEDGSGNFKIKSAAAGGAGSDATTYLLLLIAGVVVAGGSIGRLAASNPS